MNATLIQKYNIPVPRYTSYPPANYFEEYSEEAYRKAVTDSNDAPDHRISFYLHIPFCKHLCHYCGCNSFPMMRPEVVARYVKALHREIDLVLPLLKRDRLVAQIHYGGGSPTSLPVSALKELNAHLLEGFQTIDQPEIAIECHPGYLTEEDWYGLTRCGFNRYSLGVQDFNTEVLKVVNRRPSLLPLERVFEILRQHQAKINMDLLYGLPLQTVESFSESIRKAIALAPDRLVTFSYAHVPWVNKRQLILEKAGLPNSDLKSRLFTEASALLHRAGYHSIGMDHFVLPDDELNLAQQTKKLHRNFQGYCTRRTTAQVYAFGVTGISQLHSAYAQNTKEIESYMSTVEGGRLPIAKGYTLNREEQLTREVIESLMCNYGIDWAELAAHLQSSVEELKQATAFNPQKMEEFACDGLISFNEKTIQMTEEGSPFVRNVAASLDKLMLHNGKSFSKPI